MIFFVFVQSESDKSTKNERVFSYVRGGAARVLSRQRMSTVVSIGIVD